MSQSHALQSESQERTRGQDALRQRVDELERQLEAMLAVVAPSGQPVDQSSRLPSSASEYAIVRRVIRARRARETLFDRRLFADPAWDMLLELHAAQIAQKRVSVSTLCKGSAVPATTALRWITALEREHLVQRRGDPLDRRRVFVELTEKGREAMSEFFKHQEAAYTV